VIILVRSGLLIIHRLEGDEGSDWVEESAPIWTKPGLEQSGATLQVLILSTILYAGVDFLGRVPCVNIF